MRRWWIKKGSWRSFDNDMKLTMNGQVDLAPATAIRLPFDREEKEEDGGWEG